MKVDKPHRALTIPENAKCVFEGVLYNVYQWEQKLFDGSTTTFEMLAREDSAIVLPVLEDGRILLIDDEQPNRNKVLVCPAGRVMPGEWPEEGARRELLEETGYVPTELEQWFTLQPESKIDWVVYYYIARGCKKVQDPLVQAGERATEHLVTFDEFIELAATKQLHSRALNALITDAVNDPIKMNELKKKILG